jgi:tetraacyldisaccharide 4'-kinase
MSISVFRRSLFPLLFPLSMVYGFIVSLRNLLFDLKVLKSTEFKFPVISVGNITVGGTGKTPHVEYLISLLSESFRVGMISRGYKRKTKGYVEAGKKTGPDEIGDEPYQIHSKYPKVKVAVDSKRVRGITMMMEQPEKVNVVILDDAFQHRYVKPGVSILLIDYHHPLHKDCLLPAGNLRESADAIDRANIVIITKVPEHIKPIEKRIWIKQLNLYPYQYLYFTCFKYDNLMPVFSSKRKQVSLEELRNSDTSVLLVAGIADPTTFREAIGKYNVKLTTLFYPDHHDFSEQDLSEIRIKSDAMEGKIKLIITTEKDAVKIRPFDIEDKSFKDRVYYLPIKVMFTDGAHEEFDRNITEYVSSNKKISRLRR